MCASTTGRSTSATTTASPDWASHLTSFEPSHTSASVVRSGQPSSQDGALNDQQQNQGNTAARYEHLVPYPQRRRIKDAQYPSVRPPLNRSIRNRVTGSKCQR